jgi:hypothetical protein
MTVNQPVCRKCHIAMSLHSIQEAEGPHGKGYDVFVFRCECGRLAAEEIVNCQNQDAA